MVRSMPGLPCMQSTCQGCLHRHESQAARRLFQKNPFEIVVYEHHEEAWRHYIACVKGLLYAIRTSSVLKLQPMGQPGSPSSTRRLLRLDRGHRHRRTRRPGSADGETSAWTRSAGDRRPGRRGTHGRSVVRSTQGVSMASGVAPRSTARAPSPPTPEDRDGRCHDQEGHHRRHRAQRIDDRRRDGRRQALQLQWQGVQVPHGL
ncbi:MAG: hypothetical protein RLZ83_1082 [Pseudomonadota bacterium]